MLALVCLVTPGARLIAAQPVTGRWITDDGKALVTIGACGSTLCGHITKVLAPTPDGPPVDQRNPDVRLRRRPIQGLTVLSGFVPAGDEWHGRIYDPEAGKTYRSVLQRVSPDLIKVKGCIAFFCRSQTWRRAP